MRIPCVCAGKVALLSAKKYAPSVVPVMLYPGNYNKYMQWFEQEGGLAFHHRTSLLPRWQVCAGSSDAVSAPSVSRLTATLQQTCEMT